MRKAAASPMTRLSLLRRALFASCCSWSSFLPLLATATTTTMGLGGTSSSLFSRGVVPVLGIPRGGALAFLAASATTRRRPLPLRRPTEALLRRQGSRLASSSSSTPTNSNGKGGNNNKKLLVLGGTGFLGQAVCHRAAAAGYRVTSLSRRGLPSSPPAADGGVGGSTVTTIDYRKGDARNRDALDSILREGGYVGLVHCVGLLLDGESGLGRYNRLASGSGSVPDPDATYDSITRVTALNAIGAVADYRRSRRREEEEDDAPFPFCFVSAAEAGWPDVAGGRLVEGAAPDFLKRYLEAKRAVEAELLQKSDPTVLRPVVFRPSLIYSPDRVASLLPVGAFYLGNAAGLPFVDRPVSVQSLAAAVVRAVSMPLVRGIQRYQDIDKLSQQ